MATAIANEGAQTGEHDRLITVKVNRQPVEFHNKAVNGLEIKQVALDQHVHLQLDFNLFMVEHGGHLKPIGDQDKVELHDGDEFRATAPDDNS